MTLGGGMSTISSSAVPAVPPAVLMHRFTVDAYHRLIQTGVFDSDNPIELLDGWLVAKMPKNPPHEFALRRIDKWFSRLLPAGWHTRPQSPITTLDSEPEPDEAVVRGEDSDYRARHPGPKDVAAIVEVSDTTLQKDRKIKGPVYASASIPIYWIVNLQERQVEVYTDPSGPDASPCYRNRQDYGIDDSVPIVIEGTEVGQVPVKELMP
jgi:Uma2 family endonuclease